MSWRWHRVAHGFIAGACLLYGCGIRSGSANNDRAPLADGGRQDEATRSGSRADARVDGSDAQPDTATASPFCQWLANGARFETTEILWCCAGWDPDAGPEPPQDDPYCSCRWTYEFSGNSVIVRESDSWFTAHFTCDGNTAFVSVDHIVTWYPEEQLLVESSGGLQFRPAGEDAAPFNP